MRFTSNAFIVSTVALLSLITPVVMADVAVITTPTTGQKWNPYDQLVVEWTITNGQGLSGVTCGIALARNDGLPVPASPGILQSGVLILNGQSNGVLQIPDVESGDNYFMELISSDENTVYGRSGIFSIV